MRKNARFALIGALTLAAVGGSLFLSKRASATSRLHSRSTKRNPNAGKLKAVDGYSQGIDVSHAQSAASVDYAKVAAAGISFVYVKSGEGSNFEDPGYAGHCAGVRNAGLLLGAYHYLRVRAGAPQDAALQAQQYCERYIREGCTLPPALDFEDEGNKGVKASECTEAILTWMDVVQKTLGRTGVLYTYPAWWGSMPDLAKNDAFAKFGLWIAQYWTKPEPTIPKPWTTWLMWQYAAGAGVIGKVDGVQGNVDRSKFKGEPAELEAWGTI